MSASATPAHSAQRSAGRPELPRPIFAASSSDVEVRHHDAIDRDSVIEAIFPPKRVCCCASTRIGSTMSLLRPSARFPLQRRTPPVMRQRPCSRLFRISCKTTRKCTTPCNYQNTAVASTRPHISNNYAGRSAVPSLTVRASSFGS
jgi:hypothetical protein